MIKIWFYYYKTRTYKFKKGKRETDEQVKDFEEENNLSLPPTLSAAYNLNYHTPLLQTIQDTSKSLPCNYTSLNPPDSSKWPHYHPSQNPPSREGRVPIPNF